MLEARMLDCLNSHRVRQGLAPLRVSRALSSAAHHHSKDMARNGFCGHAAPGVFRGDDVLLVTADFGLRQ
jgi:uncharacterized protein YkwD